MRKNTSSPSLVVRHRFRRWCRKGYAAFASLRRAVTIGRLAAHVSERFQTKNNTLHGCGWQPVEGLCKPDEENEPEELVTATGLIAGNRFGYAVMRVAFWQPAAESCPCGFFPLFISALFFRKAEDPRCTAGRSSAFFMACLFSDRPFFFGSRTNQLYIK